MADDDVPSSADDSLLAKATNGDVDALAALLRRYGGSISNELKIGAKWRSQVDADDVMQITYVEAFLRINQFRSTNTESFRAWLRQIAQNNLRDAIRNQERAKRPPPAQQINPPFYDWFGATSTTPSRVMARHEAEALLEAAIQELPPDYATVVRLHDLEGLSGPDVAARMGRSRGAVMMLLARAHDRLREILGSASRILSSGA